MYSMYYNSIDYNPLQNNKIISTIIKVINIVYPFCYSKYKNINLYIND